MRLLFHIRLQDGQEFETTGGEGADETTRDALVETATKAESLSWAQPDGSIIILRKGLLDHGVMTVRLIE